MDKPDPEVSTPTPRLTQISFSPVRMLRLSLFIALAGLIALTLLSMLARWHWVPELAVHFKVQYCVAALALVACFAVLRAWRWTAVCVVLLVYHGAGVAPYYVAPPNATDEPANLRVLLANVFGTNRDTAPFLQLIEETDPDVILAQEVRPHWESALEVLYEKYPYHRVIARTDFFGLAQYSKIPFKNLPPPQDAGFQVPIYVSSFEVDGTEIVLANIHTVPPIGGNLSRGRVRMLDLLSARLYDEQRPLIVAGDLNITPWSPHYRDFEERLDLINTRRGNGVLPTWPKWRRRRVLSIPIDHILVSPDIGVVDLSRGPDIGSDHYPLIADIHIPVEPK